MHQAESQQHALGSELAHVMWQTQYAIIGVILHHPKWGLPNRKSFWKITKTFGLAGYLISQKVPS